MFYPGSSSPDPIEGPITHCILGNGIFTYTWMADFMLNVGKYGIGKDTSPMDGKGK